MESLANKERCGDVGQLGENVRDNDHHPNAALLAFAGLLCCLLGSGLDGTPCWFFISPVLHCGLPGALCLFS